MFSWSKSKTAKEILGTNDPQAIQKWIDKSTIKELETLIHECRGNTLTSSNPWISIARLAQNRKREDSASNLSNRNYIATVFACFVGVLTLLLGLYVEFIKPNASTATPHVPIPIAQPSVTPTLPQPAVLSNAAPSQTLLPAQQITNHPLPTPTNSGD